jgi:hypothetical protein
MNSRRLKSDMGASSPTAFTDAAGHDSHKEHQTTSRASAGLFSMVLGFINRRLPIINQLVRTVM